MNALAYLYIRSLKNRILEALRSPKLLTKTLGLLFLIGILVLGAVTGVNLRGPMDPLMFKGLMFVVFFVPYWAGRFSGGGSFGMEDVNLIFTAPILPRTVLLSGLMKRVGGMLLIALSSITIFIFVSFLRAETPFSNILLAGLYALILMFVCKLFGMYLFVAYKEAFRWIGLFWMLLLAGVYLFYANRGGWDWAYGLVGLLESPIFDLTPLVGWAMAGAYSFIVGQVHWGLLYTSLLLVAGCYFFRVIYRSKPDFYEETLAPAVVAEVPEPPSISEIDLPVKIEALDLPGAADFTTRKIGAGAFFHKHQLEAARTSRIGILGTGIFLWVAFGILWGLYARGFDGGIVFLSAAYMLIGVPSGNILAVLAPMVFGMAIYPQFDRGFKEFSSPYFYLSPDSPLRKLLWVSMSRIIYVCIATIFVFGPAGIISCTSLVIVIATMLAYVACSFMVLGVRAATVCMFNATTKAGQTAVATLTVFVCVLIGWVGMMAVFFLGAPDWGLLVGLLVFAGWSLVIGVVGVLVGVKGLHRLDVAG
ncbi:MAG: putative ABC exporter domain-containing protein [Defluviitaleaceae bacterium]|nr:putative ABC exporter domain-containing protein [Defluviitaleaceae bacterium]